jgi:ribosomal protein S18 acetylase RimI-like enzyme
MQVRERLDADLDACVRLAQIVHELDGYPAYLPTDLLSFVATPDALAGWVAEQDGEIVGHVALHPHTSAAALAMASETLKLTTDRLGVVARLLVSPGCRRHGIGRSLLDVASKDAVARGLWPILDVATHHDAAINLYESCGWTRAGQITARFRDGNELEEFVYLGPRRPADSGRVPLGR